MTKKIVSCLFALVLLLGCVFPAAALEIHIDNSQALGGSMALRYLRTDGVWVTKGWVNFGPHSKQTVTLETLGARVLPACGSRRRCVRGAAGREAPLLGGA